MRKFLLLVTLLVAIFPAFLEAFAQAPRGPGEGHGLLIDKHILAPESIVAHCGHLRSVLPPAIDRLLV